MPCKVIEKSGHLLIDISVSFGAVAKEGLFRLNFFLKRKEGKKAGGNAHRLLLPVGEYYFNQVSLFFVTFSVAGWADLVRSALHIIGIVLSSAPLRAYLADTFDEMDCLPRLNAFCCRYGAAFYGLPELTETVRLVRLPQEVPAAYEGVVPFRAGERIEWSLQQD